MRAVSTGAAGLGQAVRAQLSQGFHACMHTGLRALVAYRHRKRRSDAKRRQWTPFSESFRSGRALPIISIAAPRWNCHAALARLGPIDVQRELVCCVADMRGRGDAWSVVVYDARGDTRAWTGSASARADDESVCWSLPPGRYALALRYYTQHDELRVPNLIVDGLDLHAARRIQGEPSRYAQLLESIRGKDGRYYRLLHHYVFYHLQRGDPRQADWVRRQFLPVGNPETRWQYGHLERGERLHVQTSAEQLECCNAYLTFYNWASFPVDWCQVQSASWTSPAFEQPVAYALRLVEKSRGYAEPTEPQLSIVR